jgi:tetratricopeptide (TPR) repeat protein
MCARTNTTRNLTGILFLLLVCALHTYGQQADSPDVYRLSLPGETWALDVDLQGFGISTEKIAADSQALDVEMGYKTPSVKASQGAKPDGPIRLLLGTLKPVKGLRFRFGMLTIQMMPARFKGDAVALRAAAAESYSKSERVNKGSIKQFEYKQTPLLGYTIRYKDFNEGAFLSYAGGSTFPIPGGGAFPGFTGESARALEAFLVQDDTWITLKYVATEFKEDDEKLFLKLLDSARIVDTSNPISSFDYYHMGRALYQQKEYGKAVAALERALAREREKRQLTQPQWRGMVMTLANALGADDNTTRAKEVLEYGVNGEPTYPFFHHGLARLYGYFGDLDNALASLQQVYLNAKYDPIYLDMKKVPVFFFEPIPDPMFDPAFRKFKDDPKFRDAVKTMKKLLKK